MNEPALQDQTVTEIVVEIIADVLGFEADEYELADSFSNDLEADSLAMIQLKADIEDNFGVRIEDEKLPELDTPAALIHFLSTADPAPLRGI